MSKTKGIMQYTCASSNKTTYINKFAARLSSIINKAINNLKLR